MRCSFFCEVQDVLWQNIGLSSSGYLTAAILAWTLFALLAIFYLIPVGAVQALLQVDKLERFKFFRVIMDVSHPSNCAFVLLHPWLHLGFLAVWHAAHVKGRAFCAVVADKRNP